MAGVCEGRAPPHTGPSDGALKLGLWCATGTPAGWLPLWSAASLRQHVELQTGRVRVKGGSECVRVFMCEGEKEREKMGRGRVWIEARREVEHKCE